MFAALDGTKTFWATYGQLPRDLWTSDADIEIAKIEGVTILLWDDPRNDVRFARTAENPIFNFRPDDSEWNGYQDLLAKARQVSRNTMAGPFLDRQGNPFFEIYLVEDPMPDSGRLIAVVDARKCLHHLLRDASPGYAVRVYWRNVMLFSRGEAADTIPANWTRQGMIKYSMNSLWKVVHTPGLELAESFKTPAIDMTLLLGLIIAVLMGTLTFENWRAHTRARAAEQAERGLAELNRHLEREIANRTADLQTISDSVAHDLRNPLNAIAINTQLLETHNATLLVPEAGDTLKRISQAVRQMAEILERMLGLSTVAHATFKREPLNMRQLTAEVFEELKVNEPACTVNFELHDLPNVEADERLVKILLMNLLGNALKYTRSKQDRRIVVGFESTGGVTVYSISDNGIGFDQRSAKRMFCAFQRLHESKVEDGIGLGLAIVARVVSRHRGRIWAEGNPGQGASFHFTLEPLEDQPADG